jgi:hypothetical protein
LKATAATATTRPAHRQHDAKSTEILLGKHSSKRNSVFDNHTNHTYINYQDCYFDVDDDNADWSGEANAIDCRNAHAEHRARGECFIEFIGTREAIVAEQAEGDEEIHAAKEQALGI